MELEYKWDLPDDAIFELLLNRLEHAWSSFESQTIRMQATYYDTVQGDVYHMHGGLRLRQENDERVCCLKLEAPGNDACKARQEYEVEVSSIEEGIALLESVGAPGDVCELLTQRELVPICTTDFLRQEFDLTAEGFTAKLAIDRGSMHRQEKSAPIAEIELEFVEGSEERFHRYAQGLQDEFGLAVQPKSKLARAATL